MVTELQNNVSLLLHSTVLKYQQLRIRSLGLLCGQMVQKPPSSTGVAGLIPDHGTKIPHATGQLSPCTITSSHGATTGEVHAGCN